VRGVQPDGKRVVTASEDTTARLWDAAWVTRVRGELLRERICAEKLVGAAQDFSSSELEDPILRGVAQTNPCLRVDSCRSITGSVCPVNGGLCYGHYWNSRAISDATESTLMVRPRTRRSHIADLSVRFGRIRPVDLTGWRNI
jgi:hypothetical protein